MKERVQNRKSFCLKSFISDSLIAIGIALVLIIILEIFLRLFFPQNLSGEKIVGHTFSKQDEEIGLRYLPGTKWRFTHPEYEVVYEINELGFRDKEKHPVPKQEGSIRIFLIGDSFTFGQGVIYEKIWPALVKKQIEDSDLKIDLVNAGLQGLDTRSEYLLIKRYLDALECDVVVIVFLINDLYTNSLEGIDVKIRDSMTDISGENKIKNEKNNSWFKNVQNAFIRNKQKSSFHLLTLMRRLAIFNEFLYCKLYMLSKRAPFVRFPLNPQIENKVKTTEVLLKKISSLCNQSNKKFIVFSLPQQFQYLYDKNSYEFPGINVDFYDKHFNKFAQANNFIWIQAKEDFLLKKSDEELYYRFDGHLNLLGNQIVAEIFMEKVLPIISSIE